MRQEKGVRPSNIPFQNSHPKQRGRAGENVLSISIPLPRDAKSTKVGRKYYHDDQLLTAHPSCCMDWGNQLTRRNHPSDEVRKGRRIARVVKFSIPKTELKTERNKKKRNKEKILKNR